MQQTHQHGGALADHLAFHKQPILAPQGPRSYLIFDRVAVYRRGTIEQEARERLLVVQTVVDCLGNGAAVGDFLTLQLQPSSR